jgi:diguanylate cyclase (GGDEF)-like protein/PAS domain S-box-containing protein
MAPDELTAEIKALRSRLSALSRSHRELKKVKEVLQKRRIFEGLVMEISTEFIGLTIVDVDPSINNALQMIGLFIGADRGYVLLFSADGITMDNTHEWCEKGVASQRERMQQVAVNERFPWFSKMMRSSNVFYVPRVTDLPQEAAAEKKELLQGQVKSLIVIPMFCAGNVIGALGFDFIGQERTWPEEDIAMFRTVGEVFSNALARTRAEEMLRKADEKYHAIFENALAGIYQTTKDGRFITANPRLAGMLGYGSVTDLVSSVTDIASQAYVKPKRREEYARLLEERGIVTDFEIEHYRKDGTTIWVSLNARAVRGKNGEVLHYEGMVIDITERKQAEEMIRQLAYHDSLTGLPNRTLLHDRFTMALAQVQRHGKKMALMSLDLDNFKAINDTFGHSVGDRLLKKAAKRLIDIPRRSDTVARLGGDEFIFLTPEISGREDALKICQKVLNAFQKPFIIDRRKLYITASIGIAIYPWDGLDEETLMRNADVALYKAKSQGKNRYCLYLPQHPLVSEAMFRDA